MMSNQAVNQMMAQVRAALKQSIEEKTRQNSQRFFKEEIRFYGVPVPQVNRIAKKYFALMPQASKTDVFAYCEALWQSGYIEESFIACQWAYKVKEAYEPADMDVFDAWLDAYVNNWASCDTLCNHAVGDLLMMYPACIVRLKDWAMSDNRWKRRAAAVSLIIPARKGLFLPEIFELADLLLNDQDDLVQKGYGWMLKAASEAHQQVVYDFVVARKQTMPRTAFRYALEKMPAALRAQAMKKA